jgi:hypothetical protein
MLKKRISFILVILLALLLIALVFWLFSKRIDDIEKKMKLVVLFIYPGFY